jgi:hypothetical protein
MLAGAYYRTMLLSVPTGIERRRILRAVSEAAILSGVLYTLALKIAAFSRSPEVLKCLAGYCPALSVVSILSTLKLRTLQLPTAFFP